MKLPGLFLVALGTLTAQVPNPTQQQRALTPADTGQPMPVFRVTVVSRTTKAVNYHHRTGTTQIDFRGTELMPAAKGEARVNSQMGSTKVETTLEHMTPAAQYGAEYMTYVLWGITPEGRAINLGEVVLQGDHAKLLSTTDLQTFGLIVTAEPYYAVTQPSDVIVAENFIRNDTSGTIEQVDAKFELLQRGNYVFNRSEYKPVKINPKGPLQLAEAENAVEIARLAGADKYASDTFQKATLDLQNAEAFMRSNNHKESETNAREAAQMAEDARIITFRKMRDEALANERAAAAARQAEAQAQAQKSAEQAKLEAQQRAQADADRAAADQARMQAEQAATLSAQQAAQAAQARADADAARAAALAQQQAAQADAERARLLAQQADQQRQQAETEKTQLRERLRQQLNAVLETRETQRGLIVNINDVLFDFNKYTLKPGAREKLAKVSGILLAYPGLKVQLEGYTDSVGSDDYNQKLSQQRADSVQQYLVSQGVPQDTMTATGLGKSNPVASNDTAAGRQQNRRVDMVVSGEAIGIGTVGPSAPQPPIR
jgi:outer membrane protein OmpA-like peptidoglycan-associated protein